MESKNTAIEKTNRDKIARWILLTRSYDEVINFKRIKLENINYSSRVIILN